MGDGNTYDNWITCFIFAYVKAELCTDDRTGFRVMWHVNWQIAYVPRHCFCLVIFSRSIVFLSIAKANNKHQNKSSRGKEDKNNIYEMWWFRLGSLSFFFPTSFVAVRFVCFGSFCICDVFWTLGCAELCFDTLDLAGSCPNGYKAFQGPTGYRDVGKPSNCCSSHVFSVAPL